MDHRVCLLKTLDEDWVWVDTPPLLPISEWLPCLRHLLQSRAYFRFVSILTCYFWDPDAAHIPSHLLRHLHNNPRNWCLVPYLPPRLRPRQPPPVVVGNGNWLDYKEKTRCCVCGER